MEMRKFLRRTLAGALGAWLGTTLAAPIYDSMPINPTTAGGYHAEVSFMWHEVAAGFTVPSAGFVTRIDTGITATTSLLNPWGPRDGFVVGLADNSLVTTPSPLLARNEPSGSLWQAAACSNVRPNEFIGSACDNGGSAGTGLPVTRLGLGELFSADMNVYLPGAGTYWVYLWMPMDNTVLTWKESEAAMTTLLAFRDGAFADSPDRPQDRTYLQAEGTFRAPGMRIEFNAVPEPGTMALAAAALSGLVLSRHCKASGRRA
ncbi:PEP-CTERM sorting domain-containing protein [Aquincola tertiaricarbonis]|uniref:PEP-CTERM sorting domain-containing protein n=1 Tax=Aquincola tertiaricarbonis TaxID=391953 RepID=UPI0018DD12D2|nr:PEP-CTERM sorting domain-containing protein [Aquincola tertiaricarbonis]